MGKTKALTISLSFSAKLLYASVGPQWQSRRYNQNLCVPVMNAVMFGQVHCVERCFRSIMSGLIKIAMDGLIQRHHTLLATSHRDLTSTRLLWTVFLLALYLMLPLPKPGNAHC